MKTRQLIALFVCNLIVFYIGGGLLPLLPIYAAELGAEPASIGNYLSFAYLSLATGTASAGWLASRLGGRSSLIVVMSVIAVPSLFLLGRATQVWHLALLTSAVWFTGGAILSLAMILASLSAVAHERGRVFGILGLTGALGGLLGGMMTGPVVDHWGWSTLFTMMAVLQIVQILNSRYLEEPQVGRDVTGRELSVELSSDFGRTFMVLLAANLFSGITLFIGIMGRSLIMDAQGFAAAAITWTGALGAGVGLVVNPLLGYLSDRFNRHLLLALAYASSTISMVALMLAVSMIDWTVVALLAAVASADRVVASTLIADILPREMIDRGMSSFEAVRWAGGVFGFAGTGYAIQLLGLRAPMVGGAILALLAILLLALAYRMQAPSSPAARYQPLAGSSRVL